MNVTEKMNAIIHYYKENRGVGHTKTMLYGVAGNEPVLLLTHTKRYGQSLIGEHGNLTIIPLESLECLPGRRGQPMVLDNKALVVLLSEAVEEISSLNKQLSRWGEKVKDLKVGDVVYTAPMKGVDAGEDMKLFRYEEILGKLEGN